MMRRRSACEHGDFAIGGTQVWNTARRRSAAALKQHRFPAARVRNAASFKSRSRTLETRALNSKCRPGVVQHGLLHAEASGQGPGVKRSLSRAEGKGG